MTGGSLSERILTFNHLSLSFSEKARVDCAEEFNRESEADLALKKEFRASSESSIPDNTFLKIFDH